MTSVPGFKEALSSLITFAEKDGFAPQQTQRAMANMFEDAGIPGKEAMERAGRLVWAYYGTTPDHDPRITALKAELNPKNDGKGGGSDVYHEAAALAPESLVIASDAETVSSSGTPPVPEKGSVRGV